MQIYKCDRCGGTEHYQITLSGSILKGGLTSGWYPTSVDLCNACATLLVPILKDWWKINEQK